MIDDAAGERSGTQAVERAALILREIANRGFLGWRLSDLAEKCGLSKSTTHRLVTCLVRERMVYQRPRENLYLPGPMLFELGLSTLPERGELQQAARDRLCKLAQQTSGVGFLFFRSGDDLVCAVRVGTARMEARDLAIVPGTRRPLVVAAGGVAILMAMPPVEARLTIERNFAEISGYSDAEIAGMREMLARSQAAGVAVNGGDILTGVNAFGVPLRDVDGQVYGSIAIAGPARRFPLEQTASFVGMLREIAADIEPLAHSLSLAR